MRRIAMMMMLAVVGCGGGGGGPNVDGTWTAQAGLCATGFTFSGNAYAERGACPLADGSIGVEEESGLFMAESNRIVFNPTMNSCSPPRNAVPYYADAMIGRDAITLTFTNLSIALARSAPPTTGTVFAFGCFSTTAGTTTFVPTPLHGI